MSNSKIVLIGSGGHAKVIVDILMRDNINLYGYVGEENFLFNKRFHKIKHFKNDQDFIKHATNINNFKLLNGIGSIPSKNSRWEVCNLYRKLNFEFESIIDNTAFIANNVTLNIGVQILTRCILQSGVTIGEDSIINTGSIIEHDTIIGKRNHIAPGCIISGGVHISDDVHIGAGAIISQGIRIGKDSVIGSGSSIVRDVPPCSKILPAKLRLTTLK